MNMVKKKTEGEAIRDDLSNDEERTIPESTMIAQPKYMESSMKKCEFCYFVGTTKEVEVHQIDCPANKIECKFLGCGKLFHAHSIIQHENICIFGQNEITLNPLGN